MDTLSTTLLYFLPFTLAAASLEGVVISFFRRETYDWKAYWASLGEMVGRRLLDLLPLSLFAPVFAWVYQHRLFTIPLDGVAPALALFLGIEFFYYWYHRASHRVRWFWATHAVHHSPNSLNLSAAYRLGWTGKYTGTALFFLPLIWLGFHPVPVLTAFALNLLYQFWLHATWIPKLGPLEWIFNTPSHHRVHHARNLNYLDANYGGVLIVFDRLFGTCIEEQAAEPCDYGLVKRLTSNNPFVIALHGWWALGRDLMGARSPRAVLGYLFGPPGWQPDGLGLTTERMRALDEQARAARVELVEEGHQTTLHHRNIAA